MAVGDEFEYLSELEAAIILYAATVVADGEVHANEVEELTQQVKLIAKSLGNDATEIVADSLELSKRIVAKEGREPLNLNPQQVRVLAGIIRSDDLRIQIMNAIFEIAYSDDNYHNDEREIVAILRECWAV